MIKLIVTSALFFFLQACATAEKSEVDPISVYKKGMEEGNKAMIEEVQKKLKQKNAYGSVEPYDPIRLAPDVRKVWIVEHQNDTGDLIQGHWVFMVLTPGRWASPSVPVHPDNTDGTSYTVPVIEEKPVSAAAGTQGRINAAQGK